MPTPTERQNINRMAELEKLALSRIEWADAYEYLTDEEKEEYDKLVQYE